MNIVEALELALPELPAHRQKPLPRLDPAVLAREHIIDGERRIFAVPPGHNAFYQFSPSQWELAQLYDGERTFAEIAVEYKQHTGYDVDEAFVRQFADSIEDLWYRSPQEKSTALIAKLRAARSGKIKKKAFADVAKIPVAHWNPEAYFSAVYPRLQWMYSTWFTLVTLLGFSFVGYVFISRWGEIWRDTFQYYNFAAKGVGDLAEFWVMFLVMAFIHESAHGLTCKHYGGKVHEMGFMLLYLAPVFYVNVTEILVYGGRAKRVVTILAGIWSELMVCTIATIVYWGTPAGSVVHDLAYKFMLITGIAVVLMNLNPLIKLDGYYLLAEIVGINSLKEDSTQYVSSWVRNKIFRLPVTIPYLPPRRRALFVGYALLSGVYSYSLLFVVVKLLYNVCHAYSPEWAFVPALWVAYKIFKSRLKKLMSFTKTVYLDKKDRLRTWLTPARATLVAAAALVVLFAPVWRRTVDARFVLAPGHRAVARALVPGTVEQVLVQEGQPVAAGAPLVRLSNLALETDAAQAHADLLVAAARHTEAQLRYTDYGRTAREHQQLAERDRLLAEQAAQLTITTPIAGIVVTPRVRDLAGSRLDAGAVVAEVDDVSLIEARIFIPEFEMRNVLRGAPVALRLDGVLGPKSGALSYVAMAPSDIDPALVAGTSLRGLIAPRYYVGKVFLSSPGPSFRPGMAGSAKIHAGRCSIASAGWEFVRDFVNRKIW